MTVLQNSPMVNLAVGDNHEEAANKLQIFINRIDTWTKQWRIKPNENKSVHINSAKRRVHYIPIEIDNQVSEKALTQKELEELANNYLDTDSDRSWNTFQAPMAIPFDLPMILTENTMLRRQ
ncbi:hypothetical protein JTB14_033288 [Gonioctena quinquepunctata]|nr:hypothetical protein JTB14_033288 [Gonioctena quinquepunctata]